MARRPKKKARGPSRKAAGRQSPSRTSKAQRQARFLEAYARTGTVTSAADEVGMNRGTHYEWMDDPDYAKRFELANEQFADVLEAEAIRRGGSEGMEEPVFYQGERVATVTRHSDQLLALLLKGRRRKVYGDKKQLEHSGPGGGPIKTQRTTDRIEELTEEILGRLRAGQEGGDAPGDGA